jgi:transposase
VIGLAPGTKVFLACRPVDLRNGFDGLAVKAQQIIGADPFICVGQDYVAASLCGT